MKQTALLFVTFVAVCALATAPASSYVRSTLSTGQGIAWNLSNSATPIVSNGRITYNINSLGSDKRVPSPEVDEGAQRFVQDLGGYSNL